MFVLVHFFSRVGKCRTACLCVSVCVWEMFGGMPFDTERLLEMQFPPFLYMGVFMLGFIRIWKCCAAVPGLASPSVRSRSLALPFARSLASSVSPAGSCIRDEGLERRGRPTPGETNSLHQETHHYKQDQHASCIIKVCVCDCVGERGCRNRWVCAFKF